MVVDSGVFRPRMAPTSDGWAEDNSTQARSAIHQSEVILDVYRT